MTETRKVKFPAADALAVVREMLPALRMACEPQGLLIAGSLRRKKPFVGDIEVVFIPRRVQHSDNLDMFAQTVEIDATDLVLGRWEQTGMIERRPNKKGQFTWGEDIKLARHVASGIPVDFFRATPENWHNLVVCRTGSAETNTRICVAAIAKGWHWQPNGPGFRRLSGLGWEIHPITSEREVFDFAGLPYLEPPAR